MSIVFFFFANAQSDSDFLLQQSLLHGLKSKLGSSNVIDYPKEISLYNKTNKDKKIRLGLPYYNTINEENTSRGRINKRIENREFDLIIIMGIFTEKDRTRLNLDNGNFLFKNEITSYYEKSEIFFIDGNRYDIEEPIEKRLNKYANQGLYFYKDLI